jgi:hypothetical protein
MAFIHSFLANPKNPIPSVFIRAQSVANFLLPSLGSLKRGKRAINRKRAQGGVLASESAD